jgi:selenophosphate synthetase-related protein
LSDYSGIDLPDYVQRYLLRSVVASLPPEVVETLASMSEDEIAAIEKLGAVLDGSNAQPHLYVYSVH